MGTVIHMSLQTWGQLLSNVIDYITITLQFSKLHYITITSTDMHYVNKFNVLDHTMTEIQNRKNSAVPFREFMSKCNVE